MMLFWKIRYLDRADQQFKDRLLYLRTDTLDDPATRAAVELIAENQSPKTTRDILRFRHLFLEDRSQNFAHDANSYAGSVRSVGPCGDYFEDDAGREISHNEMAQILTGDPMARAFPAGTPHYYVDFMLAERRPIPLAGITLPADELRLLAYFVRDLKELSESSFMRDGPGALKSSGVLVSVSSDLSLETAASDEEIRSFVTIFRRLYMRNEPANFQKAVDVFVRALGDHPVAKLVEGVANSLRDRLDKVYASAMPRVTCTFTSKRLIDVFIYTQYAHQPNEQRQRQFAECLNEVGGNRALLTWLFLTEIWKCSVEIRNAGAWMAEWFRRYCDHHGVSPDVLRSMRDDHAGLGAIEKQEARSARLFDEKAVELARELWNQHGRPEGGPDQFRPAAREQLLKRLRPDAPA